MNHRILCVFLLFCGGVAGADDALYERAPIRYSTTPARDAVARLAEQIRSGSVKLKYDAERGYLPAVLEALKVPVSSQVLVFSKTSFQRDRIDPAHPRALYFNDDVYVGFVQGGDVLEIVATDPVNGPNFYTLRRAKKAKGPAFERQTDSCLQCHASSATGDLPGLVVRSVYPDGDG